MAIQLKKEYHLDLPQQKIWEAIQTPEVIAEILPNCKSLEPIGDNKFIANIEVKLGTIKSNFKSTLSIIDKNPPNGYSFLVSGVGTKGYLNGKGSIQLQENGDGTSLNFTAEGNAAGIIARVGKRLIEATGKKLMDQGFENFKKKIMSTQAA